METLRDGTELHLASFCQIEAGLRLHGKQHRDVTTDHPEEPTPLVMRGPTEDGMTLGGSDHTVFAKLKLEYADVLGGPPAGLPPERGIELELETGDHRMPRSRPIKRLSEGELAELQAQLTDLLDRGWIQHSTAGHAASVVFARKPDGSWRICYDYSSLNVITRPCCRTIATH